MQSDWIKHYENNLGPSLARCQPKLQNDLIKLIQERNILIHSLTGRTKSKVSLENKLARPDRTYENITDITDLIGFRIITYSEDGIDEVASLIENSVNKLHPGDAQKFGYRSLHYICHLPKTYLTQHPDMGSPLRFEIQIRTILQHTWAEIEHDIGYKSNGQLSHEFRRRFSQIASLLEIADREFAAIRKDMRAHEDKLRTTDFKEQMIEIDDLSLPIILDKPEIRQLDRWVCEYLNATSDDELFYPDYILRALQASGLKKSNDLLNVAAEMRDLISDFLPTYFEFATRSLGIQKRSITTVKKGYSLLFIAHLYILESESLFINKLNRLTRFYAELDYPNDEKTAGAIARSLIEELKNLDPHH